jgi:hypothetical protein
VSPDFARVLATGFPRLSPSPGLLRYVNTSKIPAVPKSSLELRATLRPLGLNYWLRDFTNN